MPNAQRVVWMAGLVLLFGAPWAAAKAPKKARKQAPAPIAAPRDEDPRLVDFFGPAGLAALDAPGTFELVRLGEGGASKETIGGRPVAGKPVPLGPEDVGEVRRRLVDLRSWHFPAVAIDEGAIPLEEEKLCTFAPLVALRIHASKPKSEPLELLFDPRCNEAERAPSASEVKEVRKIQSVFVRRALDLGQTHAAWLALFQKAFPGDRMLASLDAKDELGRVLERARRIDELYAFTVLRAPTDRVAFERWLAVGKQQQAGDWYEILGARTEVEERVRSAAEGLLLDDAFWTTPPKPDCNSPAAYALRFDAGPKRGRGESIDLLFSPECERVDLSVVRTLHDAWRDVRHVATTRFTEKAIYRLLAEAFPEAVEFDSAAFEKPQKEPPPEAATPAATPAAAPAAKGAAEALDVSL